MSVFHVLVMCALVGAAAENPSTEQKLGDWLSSSHWSIAPEISWFYYEEPSLMRDKGVFYGLAASYTRTSRAQYEDRMLKIEGGAAVGQVDYDGALMDGTPYSIEGNDDFMVNARLLWGPLWQTPAWANYAYYGLGYRYLFDDSSDDPAGYRRHSNYLYLPLGLRAFRSLGGPWYFEVGGEIDVLLIGLQVTELQESYTDTSNVENWQWPGFGARASMELRRKTESLDLALAPFIQFWWMPDSALSSSNMWIEPHNWSFQIGLDLPVRF